MKEAYFDGILEQKRLPVYTQAELEAAIEATKEKAAKVCDDLYKHDRKSSGYDEGWNDALDIAGQVIAGTLTMEDVK